MLLGFVVDIDICYCASLNAFDLFSVQTAARASKTILLTDPSKEEELALDGRIVFSVNAHK